MLIQPAPIAAPHALLHLRQQLERPQRALQVAAIGHLVPRRDFAGRVHSTFAQACNIACGDALLTLVTPRAGHGPTSIELHDAPADLRGWFTTGDALVCRHGIARSPRVTLDFTQARVWRPAARRSTVPPSRWHPRLLSATAWLAQRQRERSSVIAGAAADAAGELTAACRALQGARAAQLATRLVGWGEGLTPAGDDFLVGLCAGLDALLADDPARIACRAALSDALVAAVSRTTTISAHHLRLAAGGHFGERLLDARDAWLSDTPWRDVEAAWRAACAIGATSGADALSGLLGALRAWHPVACTA